MAKIKAKVPGGSLDSEFNSIVFYDKGWTGSKVLNRYVPSNKGITVEDLGTELHFSATKATGSGRYGFYYFSASFGSVGTVDTYTDCFVIARCYTKSGSIGATNVVFCTSTSSSAPYTLVDRAFSAGTTPAYYILSPTCYNGTHYILIGIGGNNTAAAEYYCDYIAFFRRWDKTYASNT